MAVLDSNTISGPLLRILKGVVAGIMIAVFTILSLVYLLQLAMKAVS